MRSRILDQWSSVPSGSSTTRFDRALRHAPGSWVTSTPLRVAACQRVLTFRRDPYRIVSSARQEQHIRCGGHQTGGATGSFPRPKLAGRLVNAGYLLNMKRPEQTTQVCSPEIMRGVPDVSPTNPSRASSTFVLLAEIIRFSNRVPAPAPRPRVLDTGQHRSSVVFPAPFESKHAPPESPVRFQTTPVKASSEP